MKVATLEDFLKISMSIDLLKIINVNKVNSRVNLHLFVNWADNCQNITLMECLFFSFNLKRLLDSFAVP